jgi:hypothetical protein
MGKAVPMSVLHHHTVIITGWNLVDDFSLRLHFEEVRRDFGECLSVGRPFDLLRERRNSSFYRCCDTQSPTIYSRQIFLHRQIDPLQGAQFFDHIPPRHNPVQGNVKHSCFIVL